MSKNKKAKRSKPARGAKNPQLAKARIALKTLRKVRKADKATARAGLKVVRLAFKAVQLKTRIDAKDAKAQIRLLTKQLNKALRVIARSSKLAARSVDILGTPIVAKGRKAKGVKKARVAKTKSAGARKAARGRKSLRQAVTNTVIVDSNPKAVALIKQLTAAKKPRAKRVAPVAPTQPTLADAAPAGAAPASAVVPATGNDAPVAPEAVAASA